MEHRSDTTFDCKSAARIIANQRAGRRFSGGSLLRRAALCDFFAFLMARPEPSDERGADRENHERHNHEYFVLPEDADDVASVVLREPDDDSVTQHSAGAER